MTRKYTYHSDPCLAQSQKEAPTQYWQSGRGAGGGWGGRCISGGSSPSCLSSLPVQPHLPPKQPPGLVPRASTSCCGSLASIHIPFSLCCLSYLLQDIQGGLAGEWKNRIRSFWRQELEQGRQNACTNDLDSAENTEQAAGLWEQKTSTSIPHTPPTLPTYLNSETKTPLCTSSINYKSLLSSVFSHSIWKKMIIKISVLLHRLFWG